MDNIAYCSLFLASLVVLAVFGSKLLDWLQKRKKLLFRDTKAEFNSDLFKLQQKWIKRGEIEYSKGIGFIIEGFNQEEDNEAITAYGRATVAKLKEAERESQ